jgi:TPR repeat protein
MGTSSSKPTDSSILNKTAEDGDDIATRESKQKAVDVLQAEVPKFIDDESRTQVEDYKQACNDGKGPMVACFATAEFISLFELLHNESNDLYRNVCFRPLTDKSPNGVRVDDTMAYPPGCFNLARNLITGKGIEPNRVEAYNILDRACRGDHGGACFLQAKILLSPTGSFAEGVPHDPKKAMELFENNCNERNDSIR